MNGRAAKLGVIGVVVMAVIALMFSALQPSPAMAAGGPVFLTGHDPDFHAQSAQSAKNLLNAGLGFVTGGTHNLDDGNKFLWVESRSGTPGGHLVGENGLIALGLALNTHYDRANAAELPTVDFSNYTAIVIASSFGGLLRRVELDALIAREADIAVFINAGGGLMALSECFPCGADLLGNQTPPDLYGFLPVDVSSVPASPPFAVTAFGAAPPFNLLDSDLQDPTHNSFDQIGGLTPIDLDNSGLATTLAGVVIVDDGGFITADIVLAPDTDTNFVGESHTVTATVQDINGDPLAGVEVTFEVTAGPNVGETGSDTTDSSGVASFTYTGAGGPGTDTIVASFIDLSGAIKTSNEVEKIWESPAAVGGSTQFLVDGSGSSAGGTVILAGGIAAALVILMGGAWYARRRWS